MSEAKRTPGPWHLHKYKDTKSHSIYSGVGAPIASVKHVNPDVQVANARLIAAAPDLYEAAQMFEDAETARDSCEQCQDALERAPETCERCFPAFDEARIRRRNALAKARGETP